MIERFDILGAYIAKRLTLARLKTRSQLEARQQKLLHALTRHAAEAFSFYQPYRNTPFAHWPIIDKAVMLDNFHAMNRDGISRAQAWQVAEDALHAQNMSGRIKGLTVGTSTGTSGQRGLFLASDHERRLWLGSILARCLPDFPLRPHRIALLLATGNALYDTTKGTGVLQFAFFDLKRGLGAHVQALEDFRPDVLIGSPRSIAGLAERQLHLDLRHVFTGGEVLESLEADKIERWFQCRPRPIYQATEGFLGTACSHGTIHLNEDDMIFEQEPIAGHSSHFTPIITDLRRRAQGMIRYRLNDILVKRDTPCPCGSPLLGLSRIEGRQDDIVRLRAPGHRGSVDIMPEAMRAAILDSDRMIADFRLTQTGPSALLLQLPAGAAAAQCAAAERAILAAIAAHGFHAPVSLQTQLGIMMQDGAKLRRISVQLHSA